MQTESSSVWSGLASNLTGLVTDYARAKWIDVENTNDDKNADDEKDDSVSTSNIAGVSLPTWAVIGAAVLVVGAVVYALARRGR